MMLSLMETPGFVFTVHLSACLLTWWS